MWTNSRFLNTIKRMPRPVFFVSIGLVVLLLGTGTWAISRGISQAQQKGVTGSVSGQKAAASTPGTPQTPATVSSIPISPLLFGTNLGLFNSNDQVLTSTMTQAVLQQIHMRIIRMPIRSSLAEATEIQAAQTIKDMGATALVILHGQLDNTVLADNMRIVHDMNTIFGNNIVYYEYGNEEDLQGVSVDQYTASWNSIIPQLKRIAQHANFIGPVNFQYDHNYLASFLQNARPRPDEISWHEYTCDDSWSTSICISHIDRWTSHIADARATMISTLGKQLPIMITEWNYAPNAVPNDGKNNNSSFMNTWTAHALQTLAANRVFASMQYSCTNTAIPLVDSNGTITTQGAMIQTQYQDIILEGKRPGSPATTNQAPVATASTGGTTASGKQGFTFNDGGTDGWSSQNSTLSVQNSAAPGLNGKHALHVTIGPLSSSDYPSISVGTSGLTSSPQVGQTVTAYVYIASNSVSIIAKVFVVDSSYQWHSSSMVPLTPGTWMHLTYTLPTAMKSAPQQIGIQFNSPPGSTINSDVYVNAVTWGQ